MASRKQLRPLIRGDLIGKPFRERLMLVVTSVNQCRYCSFAHSKMALTEGISYEEIQKLSNGNLDKCPEEEVPALLYAQHWAEFEGKPEPEIVQHIQNIYGKDKAQVIELTIRMINAANLAGNTLDRFLYKLLGGRCVFSRRPDIEHL
jgi:AhpD family alkylhydroperoxidase